MRLILSLFLLFMTTCAWPSFLDKVKKKAKKVSSKTLAIAEKKAEKYHVDRGPVLSLRIKTEESFGKLDSLPSHQRVFLGSFDNFIKWIGEVPKKGLIKDKILHLLRAIPIEQDHPLVRNATDYLLEELVHMGQIGSEKNLIYIERFMRLLHEESFSKEKKDLLMEIIFPKFDLISPYRIVLATHFDYKLLMSKPAQRYFDVWCERTVNYMSDDSDKHFIQIRYHDWLGYEAPNRHIWSSNAYLPTYLVEPIIRKMRKVHANHRAHPLMWDANSHGIYLHQGKKFWYSGEIGYPKANGAYKGFLYPLAKKLKDEKLVVKIIHRGALPEEFLDE